ncbi:MAG TPA: glycosyltransferase family 4 protein [Thermoanaerobaculia bacterium]|nr:glycosyltransferase family 4 protein [Thermoanaerobaculia bacterium]
MTDVVFLAGRDPFDEVSGGHSSYVRGYARAAMLAGFTPHIFCVGRSSETRETEIGVLHRVTSPYRPFRQMLAALHARPLAAALARFAAGRRGPLLVHSFGVWGIAALGLPGAILIQSSYTTYREEALSHVRGATSPLVRLRFAALSWWVAAAVERWERRAYRAARVVLVNYESVARLVRQRHGVNALVMPYAAESAFSDSPATPHTGNRIISIARHEPRKGNDVLLRALSLLRVPFRARLIGGGPLLAQHRALAKELGLRDIVEGIVPDLRPLLDEADIFVLPSREEQSGSLAVLEALQSGLAIVATAVDGLLEDLGPEDALLVPPDDPAALAAALTRVLTDRELRTRLQSRARALFEKRFAAAPFAAALGAIYRELMCANAS